MADVIVILLTGKGSEDVAVEAMKRGAKDYIRKLFDLEMRKYGVRGLFDKGKKDLEDKLGTGRSSTTRERCRVRQPKRRLTRGTPSAGLSMPTTISR